VWQRDAENPHKESAWQVGDQAHNDPDNWPFDPKHRDVYPDARGLRCEATSGCSDNPTFPAQFNRDVLPGRLLQAGIGYTHMEELGGLRHSRKDSLNTGWHNTSFRGFAD
jgi:hypothetical protein